MTPTKNAKNLRQSKSRFPLILEQIMAFTPTTSLVREVKKFSPNFQRIK